MLGQPLDIREWVTGFHKVKDKKGLKIRLDPKNCKWIQKTNEIPSKSVMYYAAKSGLDAILKFGLGQAIPEWEI